jgi:hypothetical protein
MPAASRLLIAVLGLAFALYLGWALVHSATDIPTYNDFEVFHYVGGVAAERQPIIYELHTPHQQRGPFLYPPSASVLLIPVSWLEHDFAGVLFSIVKVACLLLLWWGGARFSGTPPRDAVGYLLVMLGPAIMLHRPVASDVGNGQINVIVAAAAVGGVWLMMLSGGAGVSPGRVPTLSDGVTASRLATRPGETPGSPVPGPPVKAWWIGSILLAWAIAIKMTPVLLLAVPLLHRRGKALGACVVATIVLMIVLPAAWFGMDGYQKMTQQDRDIAARFTMDWPAPDEQTTLMEMAQFVRLQTGAAETGAADAPAILSAPISGYAGERLFDPAHRAPAMAMWLAIGLGAGALYLAGRFALMRTREGRAAPDWTWDLAMLCALIVLLSPRAQKAHLVILIIPAAWLAARLCNWFAPEASAATRRRGLWGFIAYCAVCAMFVIAENLAVPIPGLDRRAHALPLIGLVAMIVMLIVVGRIDARDGTRHGIVSA